MFDDPNLLPDSGLLVVVGLIEKIDIAGLVDERVKIAGVRQPGFGGGRVIPRVQGCGG